jgi:hypothetical protein
VFARLTLLAALILGWTPNAGTQDVTVEKIEGQPRFFIESAAVTDLSGITWTGGNTFFAVADHPNRIVPITLKIDRATGRIGRGEFGAPVPIQATVSDFEGITYVTETKTFYISAEEGNAVISFQAGDITAKLQPVPRIFSQARKNLSLESITWNDAARQFWIANEEALRSDGPLSGAIGTLVRLQQLDANFRPVAQYAWRTEPASFRFRDSGNGVSDLCLLPDGRLIVLERGFSSTGLHLRLFLADFKGSTDISKLPALAGTDFIPARKTLLFEEATGFTNFEGLTLGPILEDGSRSLIAIADSNSGSTHAFLPLKLRIAAPAAPPRSRNIRPQ